MSDAIIDRIDQALSCPTCGGSLQESPSIDFCTEDCQAAWHAARAKPATGNPAALPAHALHVARMEVGLDTLIVRPGSGESETVMMLSEHGGTFIVDCSDSAVWTYNGVTWEPVDDRDQRNGWIVRQMEGEWP